MEGKKNAQTGRPPVFAEVGQKRAAKMFLMRIWVGLHGVDFEGHRKLLSPLVLPAGFEPAAFHLGGERSILLSYGSRSILDYDFRMVESAGGERLKTGRLSNKSHAKTQNLMSRIVPAILRRNR